MLGYEEALKLWAAQKFAINLDKYDIEEVRIDHEPGGPGCPTCGHGGECNIEVVVKFASKTNAQDWKTKTQDFDAYDLTDIVREIVEMGATNGEK